MRIILLIYYEIWHASLQYHCLGTCQVAAKDIVPTKYLHQGVI